MASAGSNFGERNRAIVGMVQMLLREIRVRDERFTQGPLVILPSSCSTKSMKVVAGRDGTNGK